MILSKFELDLDRYPERIEAGWADLAASLVHAPATPCTVETCGRGEHELFRERKDGPLYSVGCRHKYGPAWSPAEYPEGATRAKANVARVHALVLDFDHVPPNELPSILGALDGYRVVVHSTHSDRPETERALRAVVALSRPVLGSEWPRFWLAAVAMFGLPADPQACDASRLYFLPTHPSDVEHVHASEDGRVLDVDAVLAAAPPLLPEKAASGGEEHHERPAASAALLAACLQRLERHGPAVSGQGGDGHTFAACAIARHDFALSRDEALDVLTLWDRANVPPWGRAGLVEKLENAESYASGEVGAERDRLEVAAEMRGALTAEREPAKPGTWASLLEQAAADVAALLGTSDAPVGLAPLFEPVGATIARPREPTPWLVRSLVTAGGVGALATEPKSAKTWAATEIAVAVATGTNAFGEYSTGAPARVAYFYAEDMGDQVATRVTALCAGVAGRDDLSRLHVQPRGRFLDLTRDGDLALIIASCRALGGVDLLVLDPLRDLHGAEEDKSDAMADVMRRIRLLGTLLGCTVLFVHHSKKATNDGKGQRQGQKMRGSSAIHGSVDSGIYLSDLGGNGEDLFTNTVTSEVKGAKGGGVFSLGLKIEDDKQGRAVAARWTVERGVAAAKAAAKKALHGDPTEKLEAVEALVVEKVRFEARRGVRMLPSQVSSFTGGNKSAVDAARNRLLARGVLLVAPDFSGPDHNRRRVLVLSDETLGPGGTAPPPPSGTAARAGA